jgi:hypothetical protein
MESLDFGAPSSSLLSALESNRELSSTHSKDETSVHIEHLQSYS